jgi:hypothetical protein
MPLQFPRGGPLTGRDAAPGPMPKGRPSGGPFFLRPPRTKDGKPDAQDGLLPVGLLDQAVL